MSAYIVVDPTKRKPAFRSVFDRASDAAVTAGTSAKDRGRSASARGAGANDHISASSSPGAIATDISKNSGLDAPGVDEAGDAPKFKMTLPADAARIILDALTTSNLGYSFAETARRIRATSGVTVPI